MFVLTMALTSDVQSVLSDLHNERAFQLKRNALFLVMSTHQSSIFKSKEYCNLWGNMEWQYDVVNKVAAKMLNENF